MDLIREDYVLGNKKIVVGDNLHDLVLENLGKIWVRYGNGYKEFSNFISTLAKSSNSVSKVVIEPSGLQAPDAYKSGQLIFDASKMNLYIKYQDALLLLLEYNSDIIEKYVYKSGDTMTGPLTIDVKRGAPLIVKSASLVQNLNSEYLSGHAADEFAQKAKDEEIQGNWTFNGADIHNGANTFNNLVTINGELKENSSSEFLGKASFKNDVEVEGTATFKKNGTAIRVGSGDIVTDGSLGSSQFMSGMTGYGWRLDADTNTLTIDNLIVRGVLNVFELVVNKISATNGSLWITDAFKIDKVHRINYLTPEDYIINDNNTYNRFMLLFNEDDYYVIYDNNFNHTQITPGTGFNAKRSNANPLAEITTFDKFRYIFKINKLKEFKELFNPTTHQDSPLIKQVTISELIGDFTNLNWSDSDDGYLVIGFISNDPNDDHEIHSTSDFSKYIEESKGYIYVNNENRRLCIFPESEEMEGYTQIRSSLADFTTVELIEGTSESYTTYTNLDSICSRNSLLQLAIDEIISLSNMFQKNPERVNDLEVISDEINLLPYDPEFENQLYTIVDASQATLEDGKYIYGNEAIARINLYCKYFGSDLEHDMRTYVVESKHDEFPVFKPGDIIKCLKFVGNNVKQYHAVVLGLIDEYGFVIQLLNSSVVLEGTVYNYNQDGELNQSLENLDITLYDRSAGLISELSGYFNQARTILNSYITDLTIPEATITWALQVLLPENLVTQYKNLLLATNNSEQLNTIVLNIYNDTVDGMSYEEALEHPIFKKVFENSTISIPEKDDALVRIGSIMFGDRRNSMYLTSSEQNSPYTDVLVGVNRPDYTVVYITPKYVRFEGSQIFDGVLRKGSYYCQDEDFALIMDSGDNSLDSLNESQRTFYDKYRPFSLKVQRPLEEGLTTDVRNVNLTYVGTEDTVYVNGQPLKLLVNGVDYFVSTNLNDTILDTTFTEQQIGRATITRDELQITLFIGENG